MRSTAKSCWRNALAVATLSALPGAVSAQRGHDIQLHALGLVGSESFGGAGAGVGLRVGLGLRLAALASGGVLESGSGALRLETLATYHLAGSGRPRPALYGGAGLGLTAAEDGAREYVVLALGLESASRTGGRWFIEAGVGGGVRLSVGFRLVRLRAPQGAR